ncbi:helix-turn-helix domain-containing protein [Mycolicibacter longobardus]|uniref:helix-turn-helix domain-containing protein n=1 Tax=Mycolicibacter longobardus TaxID=1108812 RepID=UPI0010565A9D|nr:helix-turn-helix domain-containing protein [Mycolicibacter longobardus]
MASLVAQNESRAQRAADREAERIAALGDLTAYGVAQPLRAAAEVRRDHRSLTYRQAGALLGVSKDTFAGRVRRFWQAIDAAPTPSRLPGVGAIPA